MTRLARGALAALVLAGALPRSEATAQVPLGSRQVPENRLVLRIGWHPTGIVEIAYGRGVQDLVGSNDALAELAVQVPIFLAGGLEAWKVSASVTPLFTGTSEDFALAVSLRTSLARSFDVTGRKIAWSTQITARPGYYGAEGMFALDAAWRVTIATHMVQSARVRDLFRERYPDAPDRAADGPRDGWFWLTGNRVRVGIAGGHAGERGAGVLAAMGVEYTAHELGLLANLMLGQIPFYGYVAPTYRWTDR